MASLHFRHLHVRTRTHTHTRPEAEPFAVSGVCQHSRLQIGPGFEWMNGLAKVSKKNCCTHFRLGSHSSLSLALACQAQYYWYALASTQTACPHLLHQTSTLIRATTSRVALAWTPTLARAWSSVAWDRDRLVLARELVVVRHDLVPVGHVPERRDVLGAAVVVLEVVRVLPNL